MVAITTTLYICSCITIGIDLSVSNSFYRIFTATLIVIPFLHTGKLRNSSICNLSKATQFGSGGAGIQTQAFYLALEDFAFIYCAKPSLEATNPLICFLDRKSMGWQVRRNRGWHSGHLWRRMQSILCAYFCILPLVAHVTSRYWEKGETTNSLGKNPKNPLVRLPCLTLNNRHIYIGEKRIERHCWYFQIPEEVLAIRGSSK